MPMTYLNVVTQKHKIAQSDLKPLQVLTFTPIRNSHNMEHGSANFIGKYLECCQPRCLHVLCAQWILAVFSQTSRLMHRDTRCLT